jgi:hypothetical protein
MFMKRSWKVGSVKKQRPTWPQTIHRFRVTRNPGSVIFVGWRLRGYDAVRE